MLPITTYNIPETSAGKMQSDQRWLCIIIEKALTDTDEELLKKICAALKADFSGDVLLINLSQQTHSDVDINTSNVKLMISFGVLPSRMGIWIDIDTPGIRFLESYIFILTKALPELASNPLAKKQLWSAMQLFMEKRPV